MYSLLIADDNPMIINGLKKLPFSDFSISLIGICQNGEDAAAFIKEHKPDIVITDIEMPGLNGIDLIRHALSFGISSKFIILSGHDEFSFAQDAVRLGVVDYLLKPVIPNQLIASLKKAVEKLDSEFDVQNLIKSTIPVVQDIFLDELFHNKTYNDADFSEKCRLLNMQLINKNYRCISLKADSSLNPMSADINTVLSRFNTLFPNSYSKIYNNSVCYCLVYSEPESPLTDKEIVSALSGLISFFLSNYGLHICAGISSETNSHNDIAKTYIEADICIQLNLIHAYTTPIVFTDAIKSYNIVEPFRKYNQQNLIDFILKDDYYTAQFYIESFINEARTYNPDLKYIKTFLFDTIHTIFCHAKNTANDINLFKTDTINTEENITGIISYIENIFLIISDNKTTSYNSNELLLKNVISYININYAQDLTVQLLADHFCVSTSHLRKIFSQHLGVSFRKYLTKLRMKEAHSLLSKGTYKVYEVADMVGYKKLDHFNKLYKQYYGTTPTNR